MPIYEYACAKCESEFEVEQRITEDPIKTCPHCRSRRVKRLISLTSFALKGGGWYADGYGSKSAPSGGDSSSAAASKDSASKDSPSKDGSSKDSSPADSGDKTDSGDKSKGKGKSADKKAVA